MGSLFGISPIKPEKPGSMSFFDSMPETIVIHIRMLQSKVGIYGQFVIEQRKTWNNDSDL